MVVLRMENVFRDTLLLDIQTDDFSALCNPIFWSVNAPLYSQRFLHRVLLSRWHGEVTSAAALRHVPSNTCGPLHT
jgi:hypothetical protein